MNKDMFNLRKNAQYDWIERSGVVVAHCPKKSIVGFSRRRFIFRLAKSIECGLYAI